MKPFAVLTPVLPLLALVLPPEPAAADRLKAALAATFVADGVAFEGTVHVEKPDTGDVSGVHSIVVDGSASSGRAFEGDVEVWCAPNRERVIRSRRPLPGFGQFDDGRQAVTQTTVEDEGLDPSHVITDLSALFDFDALKLALEKSEVHASGERGSATQFTVALPKRMVKESGSSPLAMFQPKVLRIDASFTVASAGAITAMEIKVVRSDPTAAIQQQALSGGLPTEGGAVRIDSLPPSSDVEGATSIYRLAPRANGPSDATRAFAAAMKELIAHEEQ